MPQQKVIISEPKGKHLKKYVACPICKALIAAKGLKKHTRTHFKPFACQLCGKRFAAERNKIAHEINAHQQSVSDVETARNLFPCQLCSKVFPSRGHLEDHARSHDGDKRFVCGRCEGRFATRSNLTAHLKIHEGTHKRFACPFDGCERRFSHPSEVKQHQAAHTGWQGSYLSVHTRTG